MNEEYLNNSNCPENGRLAFVPAGDLTGIDLELFRRCTHCGLCTSSCPTFVELGDENDGPRGRIRIMRMAADGLCELTPRMRSHLELCLDCRGCETACPSDVEFSRLIEPLRVAMKQNQTKIEDRYDWFREIVLFRLIPYAERLRRALVPVRFLQHAGIFDLAGRMGILKIIPGRLGRMVSLVPQPVRQGPKLPKFLPAVGRRRARVAFFTGCVADALFRQVHWATLRVLQQNGCDIFIPPEQGCCGAIHFQSGDALGARQLADANLVAFELDRYDAIVVNHAGCGAMLKQYGVHWKDGLQPHREKFAAKVKDVHELLDNLGLVPPSGRIDAMATYHDACHLAHAQGITAAPRRILAKIPGLQLRELPESDICCGSAGAYNLQQAAMADRLGRRKMQNIISTGASIVLAANAGCLLQIQRELSADHRPLKVLHPMELLDLSYRGEQP
ncbi:MAG: (Fe-S)-binding protein [Thermoguttaceae bacterium]|jgi:glycolate oxidase iron-sulfur subunit